MKKIIYIFLFTLISIKIYAQADVIGHTATNPLWYVGWDNSIQSNTVPLYIKHEGPQPINFYTNAGPGGFANMRMWIKEDGGATANSLGFPNDGFIGIGDFNVAGFAPQNQVHIHTNATGNTSGQWLQFTNGNCPLLVLRDST